MRALVRKDFFISIVKKMQVYSPETSLIGIRGRLALAEAKSRTDETRLGSAASAVLSMQFAKAPKHWTQSSVNSRR